MNKELVIIDRLTNTDLRSDSFNEKDFSEINWDKFLIYSLKSKAICVIFNSLDSIGYLHMVPAKIHKLMSEIFIGNNEQNKILSKETYKIITELSNLDIKISEYKNLLTIKTGFEQMLMPNDIDFLALSKDKQMINQYFIDNGYIIKRINDSLDISNKQNDINSVLYEKINTEKYNYPIKIDINYTFKSINQLDGLIKEYFDSSYDIHKDQILFLISTIEFFEHIDGDTKNIKIDDFLKVKRLSIQYNIFDNTSKLMITELIKKYELTDLYKKIENVFLNYDLFF